jgi:hypothetical protein
MWSAPLNFDPVRAPRSLNRLEKDLVSGHIPVERIWGIDDLDQQAARPAAADRPDRVCLGGFDAIRGLQFDTLVVADLSDEYVPRPDVEAWRNAARLYSTLTRARDELVITVVGEPSRFLESMEKHVEWIHAPGPSSAFELARGRYAPGPSVPKGLVWRIRGSQSPISSYHLSAGRQRQG